MVQLILKQFRSHNHLLIDEKCSTKYEGLCENNNVLEQTNKPDDETEVEEDKVEDSEEEEELAEAVVGEHVDIPQVSEKSLTDKIDKISELDPTKLHTAEENSKNLFKCNFDSDSEKGCAARLMCFNFSRYSSKIFSRNKGQGWRREYDEQRRSQVLSVSLSPGEKTELSFTKFVELSGGHKSCVEFMFKTVSPGE